MGDRRSFDSNYFHGSQARKISIGVMVEDPVNVRSGAKKEQGPSLRDTKKEPHSKLVEENYRGSQTEVSSKDKETEAPVHDSSPLMSTRSLSKEVTMTKKDQLQSAARKGGGDLLPGSKKVPHSGEKMVGDNCKGSGSAVPSKERQVEPPEQGAFPWICTRSRQVMMTKKDHLPATCKNRANIIKETPVAETVQFYTNRTSILHSEDGVQRKFDSVVHGRARQKGGNMETVEAFAFAAAEEVRELGKGAEEEKSANHSNEALRIKLSEILGTAASPKDNSLSGEDPEFVVKDSKPEQTFNEKVSKASKPRQNSDSIETDSESPNQTNKRPMTRSLSRKKTRPTAKPQFNHKLNNGGMESSFLTDKWRHQQTNSFSFDEAEVWSGRLQKTVNGSSSAATSKKPERKNSELAQRKILFSAKDKLGESQRGVQRSRSSPPAAKRRISNSNRAESFRSHAVRSSRGQKQPSVENLDIHSSLEMKKRENQANLNGVCLTRKANPRGDFLASPSKKNEVAHYDANSPTVGMRAASQTCSETPSSLKDKSSEHEVNSPVPSERTSKEEGFPTFSTSFTSKPGPFEFYAPTKFYEHIKEHKESSPTESLHAKEEKRSEHRPSQSSSEQGTDCSEEDFPIKKGCRAGETWTPEIDNLEKPPFMLHRNKRLRGQKGSEATTEVMGFSDKNHGDGLSRAVILLASALERFKTKMNSQMSKKSSEILTTVAEGVQLQLQNVESQIQADVGRLTSVAKSKRKSMEVQFLEQQERLNLIREKFKEEVSQHLNDCRSTLEELEGYQRELEGNAEKQNALHRKLLLQAEEGIAAQLSDAERRITTVHKAAKEKMFQLKYVIMECLKDGVFS